VSDTFTVTTASIGIGSWIAGGIYTFARVTNHQWDGLPWGVIIGGGIGLTCYALLLDDITSGRWAKRTFHPSTMPPAPEQDAKMPWELDRSPPYQRAESPFKGFKKWGDRP
jgi:hypothetical protein